MATAEKPGYDFSGKRILVTGAGKGNGLLSKITLLPFTSVRCKGIGRATCIALGKCGAQVIGLTRTQSDLDSLKIEVG